MMRINAKDKLSQMPALLASLVIASLEVAFSLITLTQCGGKVLYRDWHSITQEASIITHLLLVTAALVILLLIVAVIVDKQNLRGVMPMVVPMQALLFFGCVYQTVIRPADATSHYINILAGILALFVALITAQIGRAVSSSACRVNAMQGFLWLVIGVSVVTMVTAPYWGHVTIAEVLKLALVLFAGLAAVPMAESKNLRILFYTATGIIAVAQVMTNSFGDGLILALLSLSVMFIYDRKVVLLVCASGSTAAVIGASLLVRFKPNFYAAQRLISFTNFWVQDTDATHQCRRALYSLLRGGLWGAGSADSLYTSNLFAVSNDFAFDGYASLFSIVSAIVVAAMVILLALAIRQPKSCSGNRAGSEAFCNCAAILLLVSTAVHVSGNLFIMPLTGLCLPFISSGGSNICLNCMLVGFVLANRVPDLLPNRVVVPIANGSVLILSKVNTIVVGSASKVYQAIRQIIENIRQSKNTQEEDIEYVDY